HDPDVDWVVHREEGGPAAERFRRRGEALRRPGNGDPAPDSGGCGGRLRRVAPPPGSPTRQRVTRGTGAVRGAGQSPGRGVPVVRIARGEAAGARRRGPEPRGWDRGSAGGRPGRGGRRTGARAEPRAFNGRGRTG